MTRATTPFLLFAFLLLAQVSTASHFRYANYNWRKVDYQKYEFYTEQGRRGDYSSYKADTGKSFPAIGDTIDLTKSSSTRLWNWGDGTTSKYIVTVNSFSPQSQQNWFIATQTINHTFPAPGVYTISFESCCRLGACSSFTPTNCLVENGNRNYRIEFTIDTRDGSPTRSPRSTAQDTIFFKKNALTSFPMPVQQSDSGNALTFALSPTSKSKLKYASPVGFSLQSDGRVSWTPTVAGLYVIQLQVTDGTNTIILDFFLEVGDECTGSSCDNRPPAFVPAAPPTYSFSFGSELVFDVIAEDPDGDDVFVTSGALPEGAVLNPCVSETGKCTRTFRWTPSLGQENVDICFNAADSTGNKFLGLYCVALVQGAADFIFVTGTVRDFTASHADFAVGNSVALNVQNALGSDGKPQYQSGGSGAANFNEWWNTDQSTPNERVFSITLSNSDTFDKRIFSFESSVFYPIDGLLLGNEGGEHNKYYTYEIHSDLTYSVEGGEVYEFKSADDLFVFVNGELAVDLGGTRGAASTAVLDMDQYAAAKGLARDETYRFDLFYAHRASSHDPEVQIQMNEAVICSAISTGFNVFDASAFDDAAADKLRLLGNAAITSQRLRLAAAGVEATAAAWVGEKVGSIVEPRKQKFLNGFRATFTFELSGASTFEGFAFVLQGDSAGARGSGGGAMGYGGIAYSVAIEFDARYQQTLNDPTGHHVSMISRSLDSVPSNANSADHQYALGTSEDALDFTDGPQDVIIEYTPASDSGSGPRLGWIRVFMNDNLVPVLQVQVESSQLQNVFTGSAGYMGFTCGSSAGQGNVDITQFSLTLVPPSALRSNAASLPARIDAGATGSFTVQLRDACSKAIQTGEDGSRFTLSMTTDLALTQGRVSPPVATTLLDNGDGSYTISYSPTISGFYSVDVLFDNEPIQGSPFQVQVSALSPSTTASYFVFGMLAESYSNSPVADGLYMVVVNTDGVIVSNAGYTAATMSSFASALNAASTGFAVAISAKGNVWGAGGSPVTAAVSAIQSGLGSTTVGSLVSGNSWAIIGLKGSAPHAEQRSSSAAVSLSATIGSRKISVASAGTALGNRGYVQVEPVDTPEFTVGTVSSFTVVARDRFNNLAAGGDQFAYESEPATITKTAFGTFDFIESAGYLRAEFTTTDAGPYSIAINLGGSSLPLSPFNVLVNPGAAVASNCIASGNGLSFATAGVPESFRVQLADGFGNAITTERSQDVIAASMTHTPTISFAAAWDSVSRSYDIGYEATVRGDYNLTVTVGGDEIQSSPFLVSVAPGNVAAATSTVTAPATAIAGDSIAVTIQARDSEGNDRASPNVTPFEVTIDPALDVTLSYQGDGAYEARMVAENAGSYTITVEYLDTVIGPTQAEPTITVTAAELSVASTMPNSFADEIVGDQSFDIQATDAFGNPRTGNNDASELFVSISSLPNGAFSGENVQIALDTNNVYTVTWRAEVAASYNVSVSLRGGEAIANSPTTILLEPAPTSAAGSTVTGPGRLGGVGDTVAHFTITARDEFGNQRSDGDDVFAVTIENRGNVTNGNIDFLSEDGVYRVNYTVPEYLFEHTNMNITVTYDGDVVFANPSATISGSTDTSHAAINESDPTVRAGDFYNVTIIDVDGSGTANTEGGKSYTAVFSGPSEVRTVNSVGVGPDSPLYTFSFVPSETGTWSFRWFWNGVIETEPSKAGVTFQVNPADIDLAQSVVRGLPATLIAGNNGSITVQFRDQFGNQIHSDNITEGSISLSLAVQSDGAAQVLETNAKADGTFEALYTSTTAGNLAVQLFEGATRIGLSSYDIVVQAASLNGPQSEIDEAPSNVAGSSSLLKLLARDVHGNSYNYGDAEFDVTIVDPEGGDPPVFTVEDIKYRGFNNYVALFEVETAGEWHVEVKIDGEHLTGSPATVVISPAAIDSATTTATAPGSVTPAGDVVQVLIETKDEFGNPSQCCVDRPRSFRATITHNTTGTVFSALVDSRSGTGNYEVNFTETTLVGVYILRLVADTVPITAAPSFTVGPGDVAAASTSFSTVDGQTPVSTFGSVSMQTRDAFGNVLDKATADDVQIQVLVSPPCPDDDDDANAADSVFGVPGSMETSSTFNGNGAYTLQFRGQSLGTYWLNVTVDGVAVPCTVAPELKIVAGAADATESTLTGAGLDEGAVGEEHRIDLTIRDAQGNEVLPETASTVVVTVGELYNGVSGPIPANWLSEANGANISVTYDNKATYTITYVSVTATAYELVVAVDGERVPSPVSSITLGPGVVADFSLTGTSEDAVATRPGSFDVQGLDRFGNVVEVNKHDYTAEFRGKEGLGYSFVGQSSFIGSGTHRISYLSVWHGSFEVTVTLRRDDEASGSVAKIFDVTVLHVTCAARDAAQPYLCPEDDECVANVTTDCPSGAVDLCPSNMPVRCAVDNSSLLTCAEAAADCPCPADRSVRCDDLQCVVTQEECFEASPCPASAPFRCVDAGGVCRASEADCPSPHACSPGFRLCPDAVSCALTLDACASPPGTDTACPNAGEKRCRNGRCVERFEDCPALVTCPEAGMVVCPDGSCKADPTECAPVTQCFIDGVDCTDNKCLCHDGSCRADRDDCPAPPTCPVGWVLCAHGRCAQSVAACGEVTECENTKVRCPDGSCRENLQHCPTATSCPSSRPIKCSDGVCVASLDDCASPSPCGASLVTCPDGTCVAEVADCPTRPRCPVAAPVRCSSGECVVSAEECVARPRCPVNAPVLCPDGSCRGSSLGCPSSTSCPSTAPVRCLDSRCVLAAESCRSVEEMACAEGTLRCPGGECAPALDLCPTPVTCVPGTRKCQDATCRVNCTQSDTQQPLECAEGEVYCPQSTSGLSCAATIADCPLARVCPFGYVRCVDMSCAPALSQCPPTPDEYSGELVPCADGSFEVKKERCSTPVTCPSDAPYKCWDDTCRVNPNDCPEQPSCPDDQPYLCPGGLCQARLSGCRSTGSACDADTPVRCPNGDCVADVASCPETFPSDPDLFSCPHRRTLCRDGSCRARDSGGCPDLSCPEHLPHLCLDGLCTADESQCVDLSTGCVAATPVKCSDGSCVAEETECPAAVECPTEGDVRCPDGSCAVSENSCPQANGCPIGFMQCADKRCELRPVDLTRYNPCTDGESAANTCQGNAPYRCPGGMCVQSQLLCPPPLDTVDACPEATPVRCDDGSCVVSSVQCPVIYACTDAVGTERCGDGSCREEGQCPDGDTCPENHQRCPNGLCTPDGEACYSTVTGCSEDRIKCPDSSACVQSLFECSAIQTQETAPANGCPAETPLKCVNGDCVASRTECPFANGCEKASPFRCLNGTCAASTSDCTDAVCDADAPVCADGKCVTDARQCTALNGCPLASATRCANGECRTRWAAMLGTASRCDIVVTCSEQEVRCLDGTCATSLSLCRTFEPCPTLTPYRCVDGSCGQNSAACSVSSVCPSSAPVTCATGECKASVAQCAATKTGRCDYECWDGSCRESWLECALWAHRAATNEVVGNGVDLQGLVCTGNDTLCLDGSCASGPRHCPILPACPASQPMRCLDGSCANTTDASCGVDADVVECVELTHTRCPDGVCREECLGYDGCERYQCSDGSCVAQAIECEPVTAKQTIRVEEETQQLPQLCTSNCNRDKKASRVVYTVDLATEKVVTVAVDSDFSVLAELVVSSGSLVLKNAHDQDNTTLRLFPVAQSEMEQLSNPVSTTRRTEYGTAALGFARSVVSVAFACTLDDNVRQPLAVPMTFEASVDVDVVDDVCLAVALADEKRWRCVDRAVVESEVEEVPGLVNGRLSATLDQCVEGATYAFVVVPVSKPLPQEPLSSDWLEENLESVIYGTIGFGVLVVLVGYVMLRLTRYRRKYHEKRKDVEDLEEEVEDIELFGARPDEDVAMRSNPLANQVQAGVGIQGMQGELEVDETKRAEHLQRRGMIENLEEDKERLNRELERMKAELEMRKAQPVRSPVNRSGESAAEGERGFSARPKKKKQFAAARPKKRNF